MFNWRQSTSWLTKAGLPVATAYDTLSVYRDSEKD